MSFDTNSSSEHDEENDGEIHDYEEEDSLEEEEEENENENNEDESISLNPPEQYSHPDPSIIFKPGVSKKKPGIIYLSSIPPGFNVSLTTAFFANFGKVGRVFLQPEDSNKFKKEKNGTRGFTEGWIEFMSKRNAQHVAETLNRTQVGGKRRSKAHDVLWNIKYLPRFKWSHLSERLNYEKAVHHQKMRNEINMAKKEAEYFKSNLSKSKRNKNKQVTTEELLRDPYEFCQKETDDSIRNSKRKRGSSLSSVIPEKKHRRKAESTKRGKKKSEDSNKSDFLGSVFGNI